MLLVLNVIFSLAGKVLYDNKKLTSGCDVSFLFWVNMD